MPWCTLIPIPIYVMRYLARNITMNAQFTRLRKIGRCGHSIQVGMRGSLYDPDEHKMAAELGMKLIPAHKVREMGLETLIKTILGSIRG